MVGHGAVRNRVMGARANQAATDADITAMQALVDEGMKDGAYGLSTGLEYVPGRFSEPREVVEITRPVKKYRRVLHQSRAQRGARSDVARQVGPDAVRRSARCGEGDDRHRPRDRRAGDRSHLKAKGADFWGASHAATRLIREAREQGLEVYADQYPYDTSGSDGSTGPDPDVGAGAPRAPGRRAARRRPARRGARGEREGQPRRRGWRIPPRPRRSARDIEHEITRRGGASRVVVYDFPDKKYVEKSIEWIAKDRGISPVDAAIWIQLNGSDRPGGARMRGYSLSEIDIEHIMQQDFTATCTDGDTVEFGDGVPHARFYGTMPSKTATLRAWTAA